ncbi:hypothetical protein G7K_1471-t1 [Saitoella complicata NRRL Y-17804]|uniref:Uncharacterized protein n=1 Tax=Saitoella complicata (strain BCRC 22490 / CBS 7301 / JCM 7358 / NBRC 10748 / NRRL Y-17804) TaxID=698492 RepID=A0A0E9NC11_SAICN|nr:hypothetical protein G7K_1471-t1 [Saitoella complicata NRRL Y-17804]
MLAARIATRAFRAPHTMRRFNSTQPKHPPQFEAAAPPPPSRHIGFYKTYGRALSKVLLMTFTVYQGLHLLWWSLENKDSQTSKQAEIARLENEVANVSGVKEVPRMSLEEKK